MSGGAPFLWELAALAGSSLVQNKLRAFLSALGVAIATTAVIAVVSIVNGVFQVFTSQLEEIGAGFVFAVAGNSKATDGVRAGATLSDDDADFLDEQVDAVAAVTPFWGEPITVQLRGSTAQAFLAPVNEHYQEIQRHFVAEGRFFGAREVRSRARVAVVGPSVVEALGLSGALGTELRVFGAPFTVVGVLEHRDGFNAMGQPFDQMVIVPYDTALQFSGPRRGGVLLILLQDALDAELGKEEVRRGLRRAHRLRPDEPDDFTLIAQSEILESVGDIAALATVVVLLMVGIALLVGGIGIMNIMLVSVSERTREIGLRMACGARRGDVLAQFLVEAVLISSAGGGAGVLGGLGLSAIAARLVPGFPPPDVPAWSVALGLGFSLGVGLFFGLYPATRAARLDPVVALRAE